MSRATQEADEIRIFVLAPGLAVPENWPDERAAQVCRYILLDAAASTTQSLAELRECWSGAGSLLVLIAAEPAHVAAGVRLGYDLVIGLAGRHTREALLTAGADQVLRRLDQLDPDHLPRRSLPAAFGELGRIRRQLHGRPLVLFLDYDGTLTPIVAQPELAILSAHRRTALEQLSRRAQLAIISGRDLADLRRLVALPALIYAGSHGFELHGPAGLDWEHPEAAAALSPLAEVEQRLNRQLAKLPGCRLDRKRYALAVHYRQLADDRVPELEQLLNEVLGERPQLRLRDGKKVLEIQPALAWDKAQAVHRLLERHMSAGAAALYIGDDLTDEDVFRQLADRVIGVRVGVAGASHARYRLTDVDEVYTFLRALTGPEQEGAVSGRQPRDGATPGQ